MITGPMPDADGKVPCEFCGDPVKANDKDTWHRVLVWVGGPKHAGSCLTSQEVYGYAHALCVRLAKTPAGGKAQGGLF
jgi:hypothetical protein